MLGVWLLQSGMGMTFGKRSRKHPVDWASDDGEMLIVHDCTSISLIQNLSVNMFFLLNVFSPFIPSF